MADLSIDFCGISSPNPFWIASAPPANSARQVLRAFELGWGGVVWKTVGAPVIDTCNRYGAVHYGGRRVMGFNNVELISDRTPEENFREIAECKERFPDRAVVVSLMVESEREAWHDIVRRFEQTGCDAFELNYGCPHGMSERGMGAAVGQVPEYVELITGWVKEVATIPVIVKLTPNVTNIAASAEAARRGGADAISLINTINSITGVDLDTWEPSPSIDGLGSHGGFAGPAVKPIALHMLREVMAADVGVPVSGIGGISTWRDAAEFVLLGATSLQVYTAIMHHGFRIIDDLCEGLSDYLDGRGVASLEELRGQALPRYTSFENLNLNFKTVSSIDHNACIQCNKCVEVCADAEVECIDLVELPYGRYPVVRQNDCIGCNLCSIVCPAQPGCITMTRVDLGRPKVTWGGLVEHLGGAPSSCASSSPVTWPEFLVLGDGALIGRGVDGDPGAVPADRLPGHVPLGVVPEEPPLEALGDPIPAEVESERVLGD